MSSIKLVFGCFDGKVVVIIGVVSGMGWVIMYLFLCEGVKVVGFDLNEDNGVVFMEFLVEVELVNGFCFIVGDVLNEVDIECVIFLVIGIFGCLDVMFNNVGVGGVFGFIIEMEVGYWDEIFVINMCGVFLGVKYVVLVMFC